MNNLANRVLPQETDPDELVTEEELRDIVRCYNKTLHHFS